MAAIKALSPKPSSIDVLEKRYYQDPVDVDELAERFADERS